MPLSAFLLALAAAFVHALWNLLIARARDPEAATAVALLTAVVVLSPVLVFAWELEAGAWPYIAASSALELVYFALLGAASSRAEVSVVYPLARGVAPVLVLVVGVVALGADDRGTGPRRLPGRSRGLARAGVRPPRGVVRRPLRARDRVLDRRVHAGGRRGDPLRERRDLPRADPDRPRGRVRPGRGWVKGGAALRAELAPATVVAGLGMWVAYGLVLAALARAEAAPVAAVRETSVVIAR